MTVNELASGYLSLTGRPAATLSVCEYLEFVKMAEERSCNFSYHGKSINDVSKIEDIPSKEENKPIPVASSMNNNSTHHELAEAYKETSASVSMREKKQINTPKETLHNNYALDLLKSIRG